MLLSRVRINVLLSRCYLQTSQWECEQPCESLNVPPDCWKIGVTFFSQSDVMHAAWLVVTITSAAPKPYQVMEIITKSLKFNFVLIVFIKLKAFYGSGATGTESGELVEYGWDTELDLNLERELPSRMQGTRQGL